MSHFTVLVAAQDEQELGERLAPYQENNMGDCPREYLEFMQRVTVGEAREEMAELLARVAATPLDELKEYDRKYKTDPPKTLMEFVRMRHGCTETNLCNSTALVPNNLTLKDVYRKVSMLVHPDMNGNSAEANKAMQRANALYSQRDKEGLLAMLVEQSAGDIEARMLESDDNYWGYWENPNAKWDWWVIGGRWTGILSTYDPDKDIRNYEVCRQCNGTGDRPDMVTYRVAMGEDGHPFREKVYKDKHAENCNGCNACGGTGISRNFWNAPAPPNVDNPLAGDVDWEALREEGRARALKRYDGYHDTLSSDEEAPPEFAERGDKQFHQTENELYGAEVHKRFADAQEFARHLWALQMSGAGIFFGWELIDQLRETEREEYGERHANRALTYAFIDLAGEWHANATMGWFGCSYDDQKGYEAEFWQFVGSLEPEQRIYVVDCHI